MELSRVLIPIVVLLAGVAAFFALGKREKEKTHTPQGEGVPEVEVVAIRSHDGRLDLGVDGQVVPFQEITLSAEVAGRIVSKSEAARAGRFARQDDVLVRIDDRDYSLEVRRLQNTLDQAGVSVQELDEESAGAKRLIDLARDQLALSQNDYDRQAELYRKGVSSDAERDQARRNVINAENALATVKNQASLLETRRSRLVQAQELTSLQIEKAQYDLARTQIAAPVDGVIVSDMVEQGDYVNVGTPLLTIEDTSAVEVTCNLQMDELYWVWDQALESGRGAEQTGETSGNYQIPPTPATVVYRLQGTDYEWDGELWRIAGIGLDERTRTVPCRVRVPQPGKVWVSGAGQRRRAAGGPPALVRGMYVQVKVHARPTTPLFRVPEQAVRPGNQIWLAHTPQSENGSEAAKAKPLGTHELHVVDIDVVQVDEGGAVVRGTTEQLREEDQVVVSPLGVKTSSEGSDDPIGDAVEGMRVDVIRKDALKDG